MVVRVGARTDELQGGRRFHWMLREVVERVAHFHEKLVGHFSREAVADENALNHQIFAIGWHGVGRNQPAALAQSIGKVVEREGRGCRVF